MADHEWDLARAFGLCVKQIRHQKPRPSNTYGGRSEYLTQADLAYNLTLAWEHRTGEHRTLDAAWIRKLEAGETLVSLTLARSVAEALGADKDETALLLQTAGYNGVPVVVLEDLGVDTKDFEVRLAVCLEKLEQGVVPLSDVLRLIQMQRQAVSKEISRKLREVPPHRLPDKLRSDPKGSSK
jgi:predicted HTH domain antitoxin